MASDGSLKFDTKIDESGFRKGLSSLQRTGASFLRGIATATKVVSAAVLAIGVAAVKVGADFDEGMSRVGAVSGATEGELLKLRDTAKDLGRTTVFSATQAAEGMEYLAMAGFETTEIIDAMPGVLNTAAAGNVDLGRAADITSNILSGFNLTADQSGRVADVMTKTFTSSNTTMESLGDTMKYVAPIANAAGFSLEEMAAAAGVMGDAGIQGSQAGMALRNTILRLADPPKEAADALHQLGVSATDASGEMKPFPQIIGELDEATQGMTKAQKTAIISQIAGTQSASALMAVIDQGGDSLADFTDELENAAGTAEEIAAKQLDNLKGDFKLLTSALEGAGIAISENFDEALRGSVQFLTKYISQIAFVIETINDFEQAMISVSAIMAEMFTEAIQAMAEKVPMVLGIVQQFMTTFLRGIQQNKEPLMNAFIGIIESILDLFAAVIPEFLETGYQLINQLILGITEAMPAFVESIQGLIENVFTVLMENLPMLIESGTMLVTSVITGIMETLPMLIESGIMLITTIIQGMVETLPQLMELGLELILVLVTAIVENLPLMIESSLAVMESFMMGIMEVLPELFELALEILHTIIDGITENIELLVETAITVIQSLSDFLIENLPIILEAALEIIMAVIEGLVENIDLLVEGAVQIIESIAEFMLDNLPMIIDAALEIILAIMNGLLDNLDLIIDATITIMLALAEAIIQMLPDILSATIQIIITLANGLLDNMPQVVAAIVQVIMGLIGAVLRLLPQILALGVQLIGELAIGIARAAFTVVRAGINVIKSVFSAMGAALSGAKQIGSDLVKGIWNGISSVTDWILGKIKGFGKTITKGIKGAFGIKSPSTLMRDEVGEELVFGIGVGFEGQLPNVQDEMAKDLDKMSNKLAAAVELETNATAKGVRGEHQGRRVSTIENNTDKSDKRTIIEGNEFIIREEADVNKIARELDRLRNRRDRI